MSHMAQGGDDTFPTLSHGRMRQADDNERGESQRNVDLHRHRMALNSGDRSRANLCQHDLLPYGAHVPEGGHVAPRLTEAVGRSHVRAGPEGD